MAETATKTEKHSFQAEVGRLLDIVANALYSEREIFLRELISNAADACDRLRYQALTEPALLDGGAEFQIDLSFDEDAKTLTISDNGSGVPEGLKRDIFEPFVTSKSTGSGLGLSLVSKIVADHGGVVECESDPGWTTFRLLLPVWTDPDETKF